MKGLSILEDMGRSPLESVTFVLSIKTMDFLGLTSLLSYLLPKLTIQINETLAIIFLYTPCKITKSDFGNMNCDGKSQNLPKS